MIHSFLNIQKSASYVGYQDLETKQMLFELLTQPERFLDSLRRYAMSVTASIVFGFRIVTFDDARLIHLFEILETFTELIQSTAAALLEVFPLLRSLPDALVSTKKSAKAAHPKEMQLFGSLWHDIKHATENGEANPCLGADMAKAQEKEGLSDEVAAYTCGSVLEAGADTTSNTLYGFIQA
jgi:cytochrome P450